VIGMKGALALLVLIAVVLSMGALILFYIIFPKVFASSMTIADRVNTGYSVINQFYMIQNNLKEMIPLRVVSIAHKLGKNGGGTSISSWTKTDPSYKTLKSTYLNKLDESTRMPLEIGNGGRINLHTFASIDVGDMYTDISINKIIVGRNFSKESHILASTDEPMRFHVMNRYPIMLKIGRMLSGRGVYPIYPYIGDGNYITGNTGPEIDTASSETFIQEFNLSSNTTITKVAIYINSFSKNITVALAEPSLGGIKILESKNFSVLYNEPYSIKDSGGYMIFDLDDIYLKSSSPYFLVLNSTGEINVSLADEVSSYPLYNKSWDLIPNKNLRFKIYGIVTNSLEEKYTATCGGRAYQINVSSGKINVTTDYLISCNISNSTGNPIDISQLISKYYKNISMTYSKGGNIYYVNITDTVVKVPDPNKHYSNMTLSIEINTS